MTRTPSDSRCTDRLPRERLAREKRAHEEDDVLARSARLKDLFPHIWRYPALETLLDRMEPPLELLHDGGLVLDYGCGRGKRAAGVARRGGRVLGFDLATTYVQEAVKLMPPGATAMFAVMDAHYLALSSESVEFVVGDGILHHLDVDAAVAEVYRVLKPGGRAVFREPLAENPLLRLFRWLTPMARTEDEAPFSMRRLRDLETRLSDVEWTSDYCGVLSAPVAVVTSLLLRPWPRNWILRLAGAVESMLVRNRILLAWNQYVFLSFEKAAASDSPPKSF